MTYLCYFLTVWMMLSCISTITLLHLISRAKARA